MLLFDQLLGSGGSPADVQTQVVIGGERDFINTTTGGSGGQGSVPHAYYVANTQIPGTVSEFTVPIAGIGGGSPIARDASDTIWVTSGGGSIYSSADGITWTPRFQTNYNYGVIWHRGAGKFMAAGTSLTDNGANVAIFYSTDGINWNTNITTHTDQGYIKFYEGKNGEYVLVGANTILRSSNFLSTTWTAGGTAAGVANGVYAGAPAVLNYTSTDYEIIAGYTPYSANLTANNLIYNSSGTRFDGISTFTNSTYPGTSSDGNGAWSNIITNANNNGRGGTSAVLIGYTKKPSYTYAIPYIYTYNGASPGSSASYKSQSLSYAYSTSTRANRPVCGAYSSSVDRWVLGGDGGQIWWATSTGITTSGGQTWNLIQPAGGANNPKTNASFIGIGSSNSQGWIAIAQNGAIYKTPSISNTTSWTLVSNVGTNVLNLSSSIVATPDWQIKAAVWNYSSNSFVLTNKYGVSFVTGNNNLSSSLRLEGSIGSVNVTSLTYNPSDTSINANGKYVAVWTRSPNSYIYGANTNLGNSSVFEGNTAAILNSVTPWTGIYYYVVGNGGTVYKYNYSASVGTFVSKTSGTAANLNSITGNSTIGLYAVGDAGAFIYSADGETFSTKSLGAPFSSANLRSVAYGTISTGNNICVFVGTGGVLGYVDVTTFADIASNPVVTVTSGTSANLNSVKWTGWGNNWFTVGDGGVYLYSNTDATTWTSVSIGATGNLYVIG
jgi:hypothetical protein